MAATSLLGRSRQNQQLLVVAAAVVTVIFFGAVFLGMRLLLLGMIALVGIAGVMWFPRIVTTISPMFIPIFFLGFWRLSDGLIVIFAAAAVGGLARGISHPGPHALVPVALASILGVRELLDPSGSLGLYSPFAMTFLGCVVVTAAMFAPPHLRGFLLATSAAGLIFSVVAVTSGVLTLNNRGEDVLGVNANGVALMGGAGVIAGVTVAVLTGGAFVRLAGLTSAILGTLGIVVGQSQGALLGTFVGLAVVAWLWRRWSVIPLAVCAGAAAAVVFTTNIAESLGGATREGTDLENSRMVRAELLDLSLRLFMDNPVFGVGRGDAAVYTSIYALDFGEQAAPIVPHNIYLQVAVMSGLVGLGIVVAAIVVLLYRRGRSADRRLLLPLLCAYLVFGFTNEWHISALVIIPAAALGAWAAYPKAPRQPDRIGSDPQLSRGDHTRRFSTGVYGR